MSNKIFSTSCPMFNFWRENSGTFFSALNRNNEIDLDAASKVNDKDNLYVSKKVIDKISKYLERTPPVLRCSEISEEGWFNKRRATFESALDIIERKEDISWE